MLFCYKVNLQKAKDVYFEFLSHSDFSTNFNLSVVLSDFAEMNKVGINHKDIPKMIALYK